MTAKLIGYGIAVLAIAVGLFGFGYYLAHTAGQRDVAILQSQWDAERAKLASDRDDAITAQQAAERNQAQAIADAAANYEKGKADAEASGAKTVADLRSGALRLRDEWASCKASTPAVPSTSGGPQPDAGADDRENGAANLVRAAARCDAQVIGLQAALTGERAGQ